MTEPSMARYRNLQSANAEVSRLRGEVTRLRARLTVLETGIFGAPVKWPPEPLPSEAELRQIERDNFGSASR